MAFITGIGLTAFGSHSQSSTLDLMAQGAQAALEDAGLLHSDIDAVITGYSTVLPHLMLATLFCEHFGLQPERAYSVQVGGATALSMTALADDLVSGGAARNVLVVAGENRLTGQSRDSSLFALSQVGHEKYEVAFGPTIPSYYALLASQYLPRFGLGERDLAELAVLMRSNASKVDGAHFRNQITLDDVLSSRVISSPLKLLDCCPISDGGGAVVVSRRFGSGPAIRIAGSGQAHLHQHVSALRDIGATGASTSLSRATAASGISVSQADYFSIYDSFTITLAILLEELGIVGRGESGAAAASGAFGHAGDQPLNLHGGLLSYGHCGVAGSLAHLHEATLQLRHSAGNRQAGAPSVALIHGDGGVLSSHVTMFLERTA